MQAHSQLENEANINTECWLNNLTPKSVFVHMTSIIIEKFLLCVSQAFLNLRARTMPHKYFISPKNEKKPNNINNDNGRNFIRGGDNKPNVEYSSQSCSRLESTNNPQNDAPEVKDKTIRKKVLVDGKLIIDVLLDRQTSHIEDAEDLLNLIDSQKVEGYITEKDLENIWYLSEKIKGEEGANSLVRKILKSFTLIPIEKKTIYTACESRLTNFDNALLIASSQQAKLDAIVTINYALDQVDTFEICREPESEKQINQTDILSISQFFPWFRKNEPPEYSNWYEEKEPELSALQLEKVRQDLDATIGRENLSKCIDNTQKDENLSIAGWDIEHFQVCSFKDKDAEAEITLWNAELGEQFSKRASGVGPIDAICRALDRALTPSILPFSPFFYSVKSQNIEEGLNAKVLASILLKCNEHYYRGERTHKDSTKAAFYAYIQALKNILANETIRLIDLPGLGCYEKDILYWLAINHQAISIKELLADLLNKEFPVASTLQSLEQISLIEEHENKLILHSSLKKDVIDQFIDTICKEIETEKIQLFNSHALFKATAKEYIKDFQGQEIISPIINRLRCSLGSDEDIKNQLTKILKHRQAKLETGYAAGNIINLLNYLEINLSGYDFSALSIWQADLRYSELHHVNFSNSDLTNSIFTDLLGSVLSVAFNANDTILGTGDICGNVCLWDVSTGQQIRILKGHQDWVWSVLFSPDARTIASSSDDGTVRLWNVNTGECLKVLQGHQESVRPIAFSPDGKTLASGGGDCTVRIWNVDTGKCLHILKNHEQSIRGIAFSPDGKIVASGSKDNTVKLWDVATGNCLNTLTEHKDWIRSIAFSLDGKTLASGSKDNTVKLWDVATGNCLNTLTEHKQSIRAVAFSPDGKTLASGSDDTTVKLWDVATGNCLNTLTGNVSWIRSIAFSNNSQILATAGIGHTVKLWNFTTGQCLKIIQGYTNWVWSVTYSPDGTILASGNGDHTIRLWNTTNGENELTLRGHKDWVRTVVFSPNDRILASGSNDQTIRLWKISADNSTGNCTRVLKGHKGWVRSIAFSPDGQILASASSDTTLKLWDVETGKCLSTLKEHTDPVRSVAFSPNGQLFATGSGDKTIKIWDFRTGECLRTLQEHADWVWSVTFSPDNQILASSSRDKTIKIWNFHTGKCLKTLIGHKNAVRSIAFSPDGQLLASGSIDQTVRIWSVTDGDCLCILTNKDSSNNYIRSVAFSPNGQTLAVGSQDETIRLWNVKKSTLKGTWRIKKIYEGMNITDAQNLTDHRKDTLKALGAIF